MTIKDLASKVQGNVWITVETSEAMGLYEKDGKLDAISSAHKLSENTMVEFQSQYWNMIKDDVIGLDVSGLRMVGIDSNSRHPGLIVYVEPCHDDEPITEELLVETEAELNDAMQDDSFDRIRLACNIELAKTLAVYDTTKTLDLAEHTLSFDGQDGAVIRVGEDADLTIIGDGVVHGNAGAITVVDGGEVTLEDGAYICGTGSDDSSSSASAIYVRHGKALINGGAFSNSDPWGILLDADGADAGIEVRGGKFVAEDPAPFLADGYIISDEDVDGIHVYTVGKQ